MNGVGTGRAKRAWRVTVVVAIAFPLAAVVSRVNRTVTTATPRNNGVSGTAGSAALPPRSEPVVRMYDVTDLVLGGKMPEFDEAPVFGFPEDSQDYPPSPRLRTKPAPSRETAEQLIRLIEEVVDPTSWRDAGGSDGSIAYFGGMLVVVQTVECHEVLGRLLKELETEDARRSGP